MSKNENLWQASMYDLQHAKRTIASPKFNDLAVKESSFIIDHLKLKTGSNLLDVPCGTGRHTAVFSAHGIRVTGVDINPDLIDVAQKQVLEASFEVGDMSNLRKHYGKFDVTVNLFSSFGYFQDDKANQQVMRQMYSTLKVGGVFVLHLIDRDWLMKIFQPASWKQVDGQLIINARKFDPKTKYLEEQQVFINKTTGTAETFYHRMRLYNKREIVDLLKQTGFKKVEIFGNADGDKFERYKSTHPIYFAWR